MAPEPPAAVLISEPEPSGSHAVAPWPDVVEGVPAAPEMVTLDEPVSAPEPAAGMVVETGAAAVAPAPRKRGPKPMTDEPTTRIEGQLYLPQYTSAMGVLARLKVENKNVRGRLRLSINTLVRVGMSIVLDHEDQLHGSTEAELLQALREALRTSSERHEK